MSDTDHPLLSEPDIMAAILRAAAAAGDQGAPLAAARDRLLADLRRAGEPLTLPARELDARLVRARHDLQSAGLLQRAPSGASRITWRGRQVLATHPKGVDGSVLMRFPEYRAALRGTDPGPSADPLGPAYDAGYDAFDQGLSPLDNPYDADSSAHLAWEQGWFAARDDRGGTD